MSRAESTCGNHISYSRKTKCLWCLFVLLLSLSVTSNASLTLVVSALSSSTGSTGMSVAKTTVDKLLKGYDIRLRPDFGGTCRDHVSFQGSRYSCCRGYLHVEVCARRYLRVIPLKICRKSWPVAKYRGDGFDVTATMSLLCIYSHIEDGCSSRSRAHTQRRAVKHYVSSKPEIVDVLIFNTFLIGGVFMASLYFMAVFPSIWFADQGKHVCPINFYWKLCMFYIRSFECSFFFDNCWK